MSYEMSDMGIMLMATIKKNKNYIIGVSSKKLKQLQQKMRYIIETRNIFKSILYIKFGLILLTQ
jgi:hypothetical protein